ncbi:PQQ-dependent sugar dehydrogenase [Archangium minus]|uniref:PQQ-dependent sugar dehydrogenase n=1 Tax=Archangium minus TaxID=83450 RepID=A0ABY9WV96_9BACT|nr:PQQ-dependent sugar dehydrogenase [Archangium minus]
MRESLTALLLVFLASPVLADPPAGFEDTVYVSSELSSATGMAWAPDGSGRLFITLKNGQVRVVRLENGAIATQPGKPTQPVTQLFATEPAVTASECGLIGIAFDPNYVLNRYVYFFVTVSASEQRIVRYTDTGSTGTARTELVRGLPTRGANHNGGGIGFGPDGKLYWSIGDLGNGTGVNADLTSLAAKVGRANLDGTPANDNPFYDGVGPNNEYVWARGLRNPFSLTFQPATGLLWSNTVGDNYEQVFVIRKGDHGGYNNYENNQPAGFLSPVVKYRTNGTDSHPIAPRGAVRAGGVATFTTTRHHGFRKGEKLTLDGVHDDEGVLDPSFKGSFYVSRVVSDTVFEVPLPGPDVTRSGGSATTQALGGSITGGTFYDATLFPPEYRGNFIFGDFNSGQLTRVRLAGDNSVEAVDAWGSGYVSAVDVALGPDGALYSMSHTGGTLRRITPQATGQKLVVSGLNVRVFEGGQAAFTVRLAQAPTADVTVRVARTEGDMDLTVVGEDSLTFTPTNWSVPRAVVLAAATDADSSSDSATFTVSSSGLGSEAVTATTIDSNGARLVLSTTTLSVPEGSRGTFTVALSQRPTSSVIVTVARTAGDTDLVATSGASVTFTPANWSVPQTVTLAAEQDADSEDGTATFTVAAPGLDARAVTVTEGDDEPLAPLITSSPETSAVVGVPYRYEVEVRARPAATFSLLSSVPGMAIDAATGVMTWTPSAPGTVEVAVQVANGVTPDARQDFLLTVKEDAPPRAVLTRPTEGERVSGTTAEFFGDCVDEVGCTRALFYVDGVLAYTDVRSDNPFFFGGEPSRWDTTGLTPGRHVVRFVVEDTAGQTGEAEVAVCVGEGPCDPVVPDGGVEAGGCSCGVAPVGSLAWLGLALLALRRRREGARAP